MVIGVESPKIPNVPGGSLTQTSPSSMGDRSSKNLAQKSIVGRVAASQMTGNIAASRLLSPPRAVTCIIIEGRGAEMLTAAMLCTQ